ncbi:MAG TPA: cellulose biosynthesis protein BcsD [Nevskiaceae bacterium]|nr:cellulose biosynthesis protein BcsD [Nevskiaceae bacterium]
MSEIEQNSLRYYQRQAVDPQWQSFLLALAEELQGQMSAAENRAFFYVIGGRIARSRPLPSGQSLQDLEQAANQRLAELSWGWMQVRDLETSLEFVHACAPLRDAFGERALDWTPALLEGLYAEWVKQLGAGSALQLHQVGKPEGLCDTLRFRLAHPSQFN